MSNDKAYISELEQAQADYRHAEEQVEELTRELSDANFHLSGEKALSEARRQSMTDLMAREAVLVEAAQELVGHVKILMRYGEPDEMKSVPLQELIDALKDTSPAVQELLNLPCVKGDPVEHVAVGTVENLEYELTKAEAYKRAWERVRGMVEKEKHDHGAFITTSHAALKENMDTILDEERQS